MREESLILDQRIAALEQRLAARQRKIAFNERARRHNARTRGDELLRALVLEGFSPLLCLLIVDSGNVNIIPETFPASKSELFGMDEEPLYVMEEAYNLEEELPLGDNDGK